MTEPSEGGAGPARSTAIDSSVGESIRAQRLMRGMKLGQLATIAGISSSALSQIEHSRIHPSVVTLRRIAEGLGLPVFGLVDAPMQACEVVVKADRRKTLGLPGSQIMYQLLTPNLRGRLEVLYYEIALGGVTTEGGAAHPGEECCFIVRGRGRLEIADCEFILEEGDAATYNCDRPHALRNIGDVALIAISAVTPPSF
jgi:transcriptional regulator with XRE-family HTH domain